MKIAGSQSMSQLMILCAAALLSHTSGASAATQSVTEDNYEGCSLIVYLPTIELS